MEVWDFGRIFGPAYITSAFLHSQQDLILRPVPEERIPMRYVLNFFYLLILVVIAPWLVYKAVTSGKYRRGVWAKLSGKALRRAGTAPCVWFHGVSVGEIHLLKQVVAAFRQRHPHWQVFISTTTDTGYDEAVKRFADVPVFFWPLDFSWAVSRTLHRVRPDLIVLAEGEVWPNMLASAKRGGVPVAIINGRMSPRSFGRYRKLRWLVGGLFRKLDLVAAQTEEYAGHYRAIGVAANRVRVTGNVKYDGVASTRDNPRTRDFRTLFGLDVASLVLVAGSTQAPEEQIVLDIYRKLRRRHPNLRLVIVPRQKDRFDEVANLLRTGGEPYVRRSELTHPPVDGSIILVDTIGELGAVWGLADVAFVGGSLDGQRGGQNMIEPAAYGAAVLFGPYTWNFKDTVTRLLQCEAARQVADAVELQKEIARLLEDETARSALGAKAQAFVLAQQGATQRTLDALDGLISAKEVTRRAA
jgi:3-deoxy-D-manno-octulosonic-acid transferase